MKIHSIQPQGAIDKYIKTQNKPAVQNERKQDVDKVELNEDAKVFSSCLKAVKESIHVDAAKKEERIAQIRKELENGTYSVSGQDVARKILGKDLE
jgi:flagellar biosynthesis anti-sigma factor FlgM